MTDVKNLPDSIVNDLCSSFSFNKCEDLYPVSAHQVLTLFRKDQIENYIKENKNLVSNPGDETYDIKGHTKEEFTENFSTRMNIGLKLISPVAKAEFGVSGNLKDGHRSNFLKFSQSRTQVTMKTLRLFAPFSKLDELRKYLEDDPYQHLKDIKSTGEAVTFLQRFGRFFISAASIGGLSVNRSEFRKHEKTTGVTHNVDASVNPAKVPVKFGGDVANTRTITHSVLGQIEVIWSKKLGGIPTILDENKWKASLSDENYVICKCSFDGLYKLISSDLDRTNLLHKIRKYLENAHHISISNAKYTIKNILHKNLPVFISNSPRSKPMKPKQMTIPDESCHFTAIVNHEDTNNDGYSESVVSLHDDNHAYFGLRKTKSREVKMSNESNLDWRNQWIMNEIPGKEGSGIYVLRHGNYMLGIKKSHMVLSEDAPHKDPAITFQFTMKKYRASEKSIQPNFLWMFEEIEDSTNHDHRGPSPGNNLTDQ